MIVMALEITELITISQDRVDWGAGFLAGIPCKDIDFTFGQGGLSIHRLETICQASLTNKPLFIHKMA